MPRVGELTRTAERRIGRRGLLRGIALGGVGLTAAAILGCTDDDDDATTATGTATESMSGDAMTPTATEAMSGDGTPAASTPADSMAGEMMAEDVDLGEPQEFALVQGWYRGRDVTYYDFGTRSPVDGVTVRTAPIWAFIHGMDADGNPRFVEGQHNIVDAVPGDEGYSDLWEVRFVVVPEDYEPDSIVSAADLQAMDYEIVIPGVFVNCPIVPAGSTLESGSPLTQGWYEGQAVYYPDFGPNPPVAIPIWAFATGMDAAGNPQFVEGQRNIIDAVPGDEGYSDFWAVRLVMVDETYEANSITSAEEVANAGFEVVPAPLVVNCPVVPRA